MRPLVIGYMDDGTEETAMPKLHRESDGTLPRWAWPGGYPVIYVTDDGGTLCPGCANGENGSLASEDADPHSGWKLEGADVHWEGPPEVCDHCGANVDSAYGDPDAEE